MLQTIKQQFSLEWGALLLALSWALVRLLGLVQSRLEEGKRVVLVINGREVASLQVEARKSAGETEKAENTALDGSTEQKQASHISFLQVGKPASSKKAALKQVGAEKEGSIK